MAKPPKTGLDPVKIFLHASKFHKGYELLTNIEFPRKDGAVPDQFVGSIDHPAMVLSAFASELYLKCLLCMETNSVPEGHNLKMLFEQLPVPTRHELDDLWDADIRHPDKQRVIDYIRSQPKGSDFRLDLRYALDVGADSFIELRYFYEKEESYFVLSHFPFLLRKNILRRCPAWGSLLPKPSKGLIH
jgi:hypothetical protein